jgi:hypothetical protein
MKQLFTAPLKLLIWCAIKILLSSQYIVYHLKQKLLAGESKMHQRASHPYHCVEIDPLESEGTYLNSDTDTDTDTENEITVCSCVKKQEGTRYLSQCAPHLPLSGCDCKNVTVAISIMKIAGIWSAAAAMRRINYIAT